MAFAAAMIAISPATASALTYKLPTEFHELPSIIQQKITETRAACAEQGHEPKDTSAMDGIDFGLSR